MIKPEHISPELWDALREEPEEERQALVRVWDLLAHARSEQSFEEEAHATWAQLQQTLGEAGKPKPRLRRVSDRAAVPQHRRQTWVRRLVPAVIAAGIIFLGLMYWMQPVHVAAPSGSSLTTTLPDGSTVELSSRAQIRYQRAFGAWPFMAASERRVDLQGEAYFDVESSDVSFIVETFNSRVTVLGTQFNVRSWNAATVVTLTSGRVQVSSIQNETEPVILDTPGQSTTVAQPTAAPSTPEVVDLEQVLVWRTGGFVVNDLPITSVFSELERRFGVDIALQGRLPDVRLNLFYSTPADAESILRDICISQGLRYRATQRGFEVFTSSSE